MDSQKTINPDDMDQDKEMTNFISSWKSEAEETTEEQTYEASQKESSRLPTPNSPGILMGPQKSKNPGDMDQDREMTSFISSWKSDAETNKDVETYGTYLRKSSPLPTPNSPDTEFSFDDTAKAKFGESLSDSECHNVRIHSRSYKPVSTGEYEVTTLQNCRSRFPSFRPETADGFCETSPTREAEEFFSNTPPESPFRSKIYAGYFPITFSPTTPLKPAPQLVHERDQPSTPRDKSFSPESRKRAFTLPGLTLTSITTRKTTPVSLKLSPTSPTRIHIPATPKQLSPPPRQNKGGKTGSSPKSPASVRILNALSILKPSSSPKSQNSSKSRSSSKHKSESSVSQDRPITPKSRPMLLGNSPLQTSDTPFGPDSPQSPYLPVSPNSPLLSPTSPLVSPTSFSKNIALCQSPASPTNNTSSPLLSPASPKIVLAPPSPTRSASSPSLSTTSKLLGPSLSSFSSTLRPIGDTSLSLSFPSKSQWINRNSFGEGHEQESFDIAAKIILLGDYNVGKTSLLHSLSRAKDEDGSGCCRQYRAGELVEIVYRRDNKRAMVKVMDTGGQERYRSMTSSYYRGVNGCLLMFDVTREDTFNNIVIWHQDLGKYSTDNVAAIMVGSTSHLGQRAVTPERAFKLAESLGISYLECSPGDEVMTLAIVQRLMEHILKVGLRRASFTIEIKPQSVEHKKSNYKQIVCLC